MSRFKMVYNKKKENENLLERKENGWDTRFHVASKSPNPLKQNQVRNYNTSVNTVHQENYQHFLTNLNNKAKIYDIKPKSRGKSNLGPLTTNKNNSILDRNNHPSNKSRISNVGNKTNDSILNTYNKKEIIGDDNKYAIIKQLWTETGVTEAFKGVFENIASQLDPIYRKGYYEHEISSLKKMKDKLIKLSNEILAREKTIELLHQLDRYLTQDIDKVLQKKLMSDAVKAFQHLRVLSINIVNHFIKLRKVSSYALMNGKYDFDRISTNVSSLTNLHINLQSDSQLPLHFDKNYLIKMKNDTDFLSISHLSKFFKFANDSDPFLVSLSTGNGSEFGHFTHENGIEKLEKINVPIDESMLGSINTCQYVILEELAYYELNQNYIKNEVSISTGKSSANRNKVSSGKNVLHINQNSKKNELRPLNLNKSKILGIDESTSKSPLARNLNPISPGMLDNGSAENAIYNKLANKNKDLETVNIHSKHYKLDSISMLNDSKVSNTTKENLKKSDLIIKETELKKIENIINRHKQRENEIKDTIGERLKKDEVKIIKKEKIEIDDSKVIISNNNYNPSPINKVDKTHLEDDTQTFELLRKMDEQLMKMSLDDAVEEEKHDEVNINVEELINNPLEEVKTEEKIINDRVRPSTPTLGSDKAEKEIEIINVCEEKDDEKGKTLEKESENNDIIRDKTQFNSNVPEVSDSSPDNQISEADFDISKISFTFFKEDLQEFQPIYEQYLTKVDNEQKVIFKIDSNILTYLKGIFTKIILFNYSDGNFSSLIGMASVHHDPNSDNNKLILSHFSTLYDSFYYEIFEKLLTFIKSSVICDEIYLELYYGHKGDGFYINEKISDIIKKKLKFKWITLENTGTERRTKYRMLNNNKPDKPNEEFKYMLRQRSSVTVSLKGKDEEVGDSPDFLENEINLFTVTCVLGEMIYNFDYVVKNQQFKALNFDKLKRLSKNFVKTLGSGNLAVKEYINEVYFEGGDSSNLQQQFHNAFDKITENFLFTSLISISSKFENIMTVKYNNSIFNRIQSNIDILKHTQTGKSYYLVRTTNENFTTVIGEVDENFNKDSKNISSAFIEIYSKLDQNVSTTKNAIFLPCFNKTQISLFNNPKIISDVQILQDDENFTLKECLSTNEIYLSSDNSIYGLNLTESIFSVPFNVDNDILISKPFFIAIINLELLSELNIPVVSVSVIRETDFLKF